MLIKTNKQKQINLLLVFSQPLLLLHVCKQLKNHLTSLMAGALKKTVLVPVADGSEDLEAVTMIDVFLNYLF